MTQTVIYTSEPPEDFQQLEALYASLGWNAIHLSVTELNMMCLNSWYAVYAFEGQKLVGMGRVISDGVITGVICGLGVHPDYQSRGIGRQILQRLVEHCEKSRVFPQLMCEEGLEPYYEKLGFQRFTVGMKKNIQRTHSSDVP
ncbi:GNAT family N-acetyltransferase [Paenibacillus lautus]|jgi:ribosomal protein S18 acetylase RimI-like enzyme|uniref:GNAT family N-acetyltransferase n=1 Tax=Paenibacillus lautus TaxID=1401 RepID=A0A385TK29_PAELA|nr:GNAT family N-acetyltransferase [Paenibacillus lautus]AYB43338.1 GNAT family N-acetyltransferase [Paenibacillus lautus]MCI1777592.1 GNAT family N-acetyltransferase [Paenibacillus lautus]VTR38516.1 ribosomal-protein-alanine acetyltransferase [Actinobacillus pleuropneumoniae]